MQVEILVEIQSAVVKRYASEDLEFSGVFYERGIIEPGSIASSLTEIFYGTTQLNSINITIDDSKGEIRALRDSEDLRKVGVIVKRVDRDTDTVLEQFYFTINSVELKINQANITCEVRELDVWQSDVPNWKFSKTETYGEASPVFPDIPDKDVIDQRIPTWFGECKKIPLFYVRQDWTAKEYDYVIGWGTIAGVDAVYRNFKVVNSLEYTVFDGSQVSPYPGFAFIRFGPYSDTVPQPPGTNRGREQRDFSYNLYSLQADIRGIKIGGVEANNPALIWQEWLTNTKWGLSLTTNAASFTTAAALCTALGLELDGGFRSVASALTWSKEFANVTRMGILKKNSSGDYELTIPIYKSTIEASFDEHNCVIASDSTTPVDNCIKKIEVKYWFDYEWDPDEKKYASSQTYLQTNTKDVMSFGEEREFPLQLVRVPYTASRIAQYLKNRLIYADKKIKLVVGEDAQALVTPLKEGSIINVNNIVAGVVGTFEVTEITKSQSQFELTALSYSSHIFDFILETDPPTPPDKEPDYRYTEPGVVTSLVMTPNSGMSAKDGMIHSWFDITFVVPTTWVDSSGNVANFKHAIIYLNQQGETAWTEIGRYKTGKAVTPSVTPGLQYRIKVVSENDGGKLSSEVFAPNVPPYAIAAGDTSAPSKPATPVATAKLSSILITWAANSEPDFKTYYIWRNIGGGAYSKIAETASTTYIDQAVAAGGDYTYKVSALDFSKNESPLSNATSSVTPTSLTPEDADLCLQEWSYTGVFSSSDYQSIAWTGGTLKFSGGYTKTIAADSYSPIPAGGIGICVYFHSSYPNVFKTTTSWTLATGSGKVLIARGIANSNHSSPASIITNQTLKGTVTGDDIVVNAITAGHINAGVITADKLNVLKLEAVSAHFGNLSVWDGKISGNGVKIDFDNALIEVSGSARIDVKNDLNIKTGGEITVESGGTIDVKTGGNLNLTGGKITVTSAGEINISSGKLNVTSSGEININSGKLNITSGTTVISGGSITIKTSSSFVVETASSAYMAIVGKGGLRIGREGDIIFYKGSPIWYEVGRIEVNDTDLRIVPGGSSNYLYLGDDSSGNRWPYIQSYATYDIGFFPQRNLLLGHRTYTNNIALQISDGVNNQVRIFLPSTLNGSVKTNKSLYWTLGLDGKYYITGGTPVPSL